MDRIFSGNNLNPMDTDATRKRDMHIFLTHYHWDHIQGFPFFAPAFLPGSFRVNINFYGKKNAKTRLSHVLSGQQQYPNFPVEWQAMPCGKKYTELGRLAPFDISIGSATVRYAELDHPDRVFGYSIEAGGRKFVCGTDTEHRDVEDPVLVKLAKDADMLYYDAQYLPEEYSGKAGGMPRVRWGHSTYEWAIRTAAAANVGTVVLGHHDPYRGDAELGKIAERANEYRDAVMRERGADRQLNVIMARQGMEYEL